MRRQRHGYGAQAIRYGHYARMRALDAGSREYIFSNILGAVSAPHVAGARLHKRAQQAPR